MADWREDLFNTLDKWNELFSNFISNVESILEEDAGWETIENVEELLSEEEKELLRKNNLHFNLPEGIGDAYNLRSQVQALISDGEWIN